MPNTKEAPSLKLLRIALVSCLLELIYGMDAPPLQKGLVDLTGDAFSQGATHFTNGMTGEILAFNDAGDAHIAFRAPDNHLGAQWILKQNLTHFSQHGSAPRPHKPEPETPTDKPDVPAHEPTNPSAEPSSSDMAELLRGMREMQRQLDEQRRQMAQMEAEIKRLRDQVEHGDKPTPSGPHPVDPTPVTPTPNHPSKPTAPVTPVEPTEGGQGGEANPPTWPASVQVFGPETPTNQIDQAVQTAYALNGGRSPHDLNGEFSEHRFAFLFKPGTYANDVPVGYYTQVLGLGAKPADVVFNGKKGVHCEEQSYTVEIGALCNFWRSAENFRSDADWLRGEGQGMLWAVSQAAPLRRIEVANDLLCYQYEMTSPTNPAGPNAIQTLAGFSSGGFCADMTVGGKTVMGSQQQWFARNSKFATPPDTGVWNMVYGGVEGAPASHFSNIGGIPTTTIPKLPTTSSKPFVVIDGEGKYSLVIPAVHTNTSGPQGQDARDRVVSFSDVYVTSPSDSAATINEKLAKGLHVVVTPGIYHLEEALELRAQGQVLLGLGLATLIPVGGDHPAIRVANVDGARIAGLLVQAGPVSNGTDVLVEIGDGSHAGDAANPTFIHDLFVRVGGPDGGPGEDDVAADVMLRVGSGNVIGDNLWLWRADHTASSRGTASTGDAGKVRGTSRCNNGIVIDGDDVIMYGLMVEHTLEDLTQWNGERGRCYFYQSELPYDVDDSDGGWASGRHVGYRVNEGVKHHEAWGIGVYCYFRDHVLNALRAISCPTALENNFHNSLKVKLNGFGNVANVLNNNRGVAGQQPTGPDRGAPTYLRGEPI